LEGVALEIEMAAELQQLELPELQIQAVAAVALEVVAQAHSEPPVVLAL
jgi:hypothetical protein